MSDAPPGQPLERADRNHLLRLPEDLAPAPATMEGYAAMNAPDLGNQLDAAVA